MPSIMNGKFLSDIDDGDDDDIVKEDPDEDFFLLCIYRYFFGINFIINTRQGIKWSLVCGLF